MLLVDNSNVKHVMINPKPVMLAMHHVCCISLFCNCVSSDRPHVKKKKLSSSSTRRDDDDDDDDAPLHAKKQTIVHTLLQTLPLYWKQGSTMTSTTTSSSSLSLSLSLPLSSFQKSSEHQERQKLFCRFAASRSNLLPLLLLLLTYCS
jgi:hypothetical protein